MIRVKNFRKSYGDLIAVNDLSFEVGPGDILGLVGSNGAGKSTTLRTLSGIIGPTSGSLEIAGHDIVTAPIEAKQSLGYIPDDPRLFRYPDGLGTSRLFGVVLRRDGARRQDGSPAHLVRSCEKTRCLGARPVARHAPEGGDRLRLSA